jgi:hypothetical protein
MSNSPDGGQDKFDCARAAHPKTSRRMTLLPCEIDQAKPDRISRLARSTKLSKIREGDPPERALLDRGPDCYARVSSKLDALTAFSHSHIQLVESQRRFGANFSRLSKIRLSVKPKIQFSFIFVNL